ncbi:hypothetical protein A2U01_0062848, partial [Trifolium medium]|nr:hypothetical protein [Trifolium medium]
MKLERLKTAKNEGLSGKNNEAVEDEV